MALYDDVYNKLVSERAKYPARNLTPQQLGLLLNATTYPFKDQGVGMEAKSGGQVAVLPNGTTVASDIIRFGNMGGDFLGDSDGAAVPTRGELKPASAPFVSPLLVVDVPPGPDPTPTPEPIPDPIPVLLLRLIAITEDQTQQFKDGLAALKQSIADLQRNGIKVRF